MPLTAPPGEPEFPSPGEVAGGDRRVSLRRFALLRLAGLVAGIVVLVVGLLALLVIVPLARSNAQSSFRAATQGVAGYLSDLNRSTSLTLREGRRWWQLNSPVVDDPYAFNDFFRPLLAVNPLATSVVAGQVDGQGWLLLQTGDGQWRNRLTHVARWGTEHRILDHDASGHTRASTLTSPYDARQRPWFTAVMALPNPDEVAWTEPYLFFTTGEPGITASIRLGVGAAPGIEGALGMDLKLRDISSVTMASQVGEHGYAAVLTDDGRVLALPRKPQGVSDSRWQAHVLQPAGQLELAPLSVLVAQWTAQGREPMDVQTVAQPGGDWLASVHPYRLGAQRLWVLALAPESDFAPAWGVLWASLAGGLLLLLVPVGWLVKQQTRALVQPLEVLARNSERIGQLEFGVPPEPVDSEVKELRQLAHAQRHMSELLGRHQRDLDRQIHALEQARDEIHRLAYFDPLTHLPNRRLLMDRLDQALVRCRRDHSLGFLLFIDLDNFKALNDTRGHSAGDMLLQLVAQRLLGCVSATDSVGRLGGDEFLVLLQDWDRSADTRARVMEEARQAAEQIRQALCQPASLAGAEFVITPSIGVVPFEGEEPLENLLKWADMAMYRAKAAGRNGVCFFDPVFQQQAERLVGLESDLRVALRRNDLHMWLQPQFNTRLQPVGAEALVRWHHPVRGWVPPAEFIPVAESVGLIAALGDWMLVQACHQLARWARYPQTADWTLSVNVSARQFRHPEFVGRTLQALRDSGVNPQRLRLELTESALLDDMQQTVERMEALRQMGVLFSLDDFGTGYSSLSYLKQLPFVELKVDQSFVRDMLTDPSDAALIHAMVVMSQALGLSVLAEGVETRDQFDALVADGCDLFQGYLLGHPVGVDEFQRLWGPHA